MDNSERSEWREVRLEDLTLGGATGVVDGPFGSAVRKADYTDQGVPVLRGINLGLGDVRIRLDRLVFISEELAAKYARAKAIAGDLVFTKKGTLGSIGILPTGTPFREFFISSNQMRARVDPALADPYFLFHVFGAVVTRERLVREATITGVPKINLKYLRGFKVSVPPLPEQRRIAAVLAAFDDKIEINRKMNQTLEAMAQALFKSWFVDFDPVIDNALRAKQPIPDDLAEKAERRRAVMARDSYTIPPYADLFPDHFEDSELGSIPAEWRAGHLGDLMELKRGYDLPKRMRKHGSVEIISSSGASGWHDEAKVKGPGVVTGRYGTIGDVYFVDADFWPLNTALYVRDFKGNSKRFIYHLLSTVNFEAHTGKSAVPGVNRNHLHQEPAVLPAGSIQELFGEAVGPLWAKHVASSKESSTLSALRDTLLPKLISGEVRVPAFAVPEATE